MKLVNIGTNQPELQFDNNNTQVFFSYETPVSAYSDDTGYIRTNVSYSVTTTRHINKWVGDNKCETVSQDVINNLVKTY